MKLRMTLARACVNENWSPNLARDLAAYVARGVRYAPPVSRSHQACLPPAKWPPGACPLAWDLSSRLTSTAASSSWALPHSSAERQHECRRGKHECLRHGLKCRPSDQCVAHALLRAARTLTWPLVPQMR